MRKRGASLGLGILGALLLGGMAVSAAPDHWWSPGDGRPFPAVLDYENEHGASRLLMADGPLDTRGHPFFTPMGPDARACVTCHQPADGMSITVASVQKQWALNGPRDPLFAAYDGSNCPSLPQADRTSHSLLLDHGLIRIARPWPPREHDGTVLKPDFTIEVVRDPSTCNLDARYGLTSADPQVSVFRRPRPVANFKYIEAMGFSYDPKAGMPLPLDPDTGMPVSGNLMADGRVLSLTSQMREAAGTHLQFLDRMSDADIARILAFERQIYSAQQVDKVGGPLNAAGAAGGAETLATSQPGRLGSQGTAIWSEFEAWEKPDAADPSNPERTAWRQSVARGARLFRDRTFLITDSAGVNSPVGFGNPTRNGCAFCHNMSQMGMDVAPGQLDLGTTNQPFSNPVPHLPLFRITCTGRPHPFYGRTILTSDPGYALTTGKCADVGKITLQTIRSMASRAPYFANGSARTIRDVIDFYDRRYNIHYTEQEKQDLVNLLSAL